MSGKRNPAAEYLDSDYDDSSDEDEGGWAPPTTTGKRKKAAGGGGNGGSGAGGGKKARGKQGGAAGDTATGGRGAKKPKSTKQKAQQALSSRASAKTSLLKLQPGVGGLDGDEYGDGEDGDGSMSMFKDFSNMVLKKDHHMRPVWVCPDGHIYLEASSPIYAQAYDFLVAIAEPVSRPEFVHEYRLTPYSLYAAVAVAINTESIISVLRRLSKCVVPDSVETFIRECTVRYGKAKLVLKENRYYVESPHPEVLRELLKDETIAGARVKDESQAGGDSASSAGAAAGSGGGGVGQQGSGSARGAGTGASGIVKGVGITGADGFTVTEAPQEMAENLEYQDLVKQVGAGDDEDDDNDLDADVILGTQPGQLLQNVSFRIRNDMVEEVKKAAIGIDYPLMEEYDFNNDKLNPKVNMQLRPSTKIRTYQEKSLAKMFGNGRARSGIVVLPCGAGKTLTGVTAASTINKSCICLCTSAVSVQQWKSQFKLWTDIADDQISCFTSGMKQALPDKCGVLITTYTMISFSGKRSLEAQRIIDAIQGREWGLMLLDEVHVVPAKMFRKVLGVVNAHCKLGLTATLVREDDLISDLNFLIGPKLYEANWMDLTQAGYLANVQCVEAWCPMTAEFYSEYLKEGTTTRWRELLYVMNPNKFRTAEFLINFHKQRHDKIILFADNVFALKVYSQLLKIPYIYGETPHGERERILSMFRVSKAGLDCIGLSKVGDTSIDIPEANVIVQVSSHFGSRRQEAQRLGRILRPKLDTDVADGFNAFFYTLVSTDTAEMHFSAKRQQYLVDQGYTYKVVTDLVDNAQQDGALMTKKAEMLLLRDMLNADYASMMAEEENALKRAEADQIEQNGPGGGGGGGKPKVKRKVGNINNLSGGAGTRYLEYSTGGGGKGGGKGSSSSSSNKPQHALFKKRFLKVQSKPS